MGIPINCRCCCCVRVLCFYRVLRRLYATFILGRALQNFGTGQLFWARSAWFTRQSMFKFFQCWFLKRHPWNKNGTLKLVSPCAYMTAVHLRLHAHFAGWIRRAFVWLVQKAKTSVVIIKGRNKVIPCTTLICTKVGAIRPAESYFELFESSSLNWERYGRIPILFRDSTWSKHPFLMSCGIPSLE